MDWFAQRARAAYGSQAEIIKKFPDTVRVATVPGTDVQYFLERDSAHRRQVISVRGTYNLGNLREDAEFNPDKNAILGIYVHAGFDADAFKVYQDVLPHLQKGESVRVTGHSLGAAISTLLMMYLHLDGFRVEPSINFGQPKLTDLAGAQAWEFLPLLRVVDRDDLVPLLPPKDWLDPVHGAFRHFGREVILLDQTYYVYLSEHQDMLQPRVSSFWDNLGSESLEDHRIDNYLRRITDKLQRAMQVPYKQRELYQSLNL